ncbi:hypothetical protein [Polaribacter reichenbachii]|nr:hypothetical protein [Polaribacter reichenbachii]
MLIKKQEAAKNRKAALKYELQKRRESQLKKGNQTEIEFPEVSKEEMETLKDKIRKKYKAQRIKTVILDICLFIFVLLLFYFILRNKIKF